MWDGKEQWNSARPHDFLAGKEFNPNNCAERLEAKRRSWKPGGGHTRGEGVCKALQNGHSIGRGKKRQSEEKRRVSLSWGFPLKETIGPARGKECLGLVRKFFLEGVSTGGN